MKDPLLNGKHAKIMPKKVNNIFVYSLNRVCECYTRPYGAYKKGKLVAKFAQKR